MAERCNFNAYCLFSLVNTVVYCLPAHWMWAPNGFLRTLGAVDIAGIPPVLTVGAPELTKFWLIGLTYSNWGEGDGQIASIILAYPHQVVSSTGASFTSIISFKSR